MKTVFLFTSRNKGKIILVFRILYAAVFIVWAAGFFLSLNSDYRLKLYNFGVLTGRVSLIIFCITITPGILKRFGKTWSIRMIIMLLRRQFGVLTFSFAFLHFSLMRLFPFLNGDYTLRFPLLKLEIFGLLSLFFIFLLFLTSNDYSVRKLGKWWDRLHKLIYIIAWTIALHVALIRISIYSIIIIGFAVLETVSLVYFYLLRKKPHSPSFSPSEQQ